MTAVATLIIAISRRGNRRKAISRLAKKLRLAIVITGIKYMKLFLGDQYDCFGDWPCYSTEAREDLATSGWTESPGVDDGLSLDSTDTARLMFVRQR
ncbi:unnamed protein product [Sphacelaria rigidula]